VKYRVYGSNEKGTFTVKSFDGTQTTATIAFNATGWAFIVTQPQHDLAAGLLEDNLGPQAHPFWRPFLLRVPLKLSLRTGR
jgi:hypothetical protein